MRKITELNERSSLFEAISRCPRRFHAFHWFYIGDIHGNNITSSILLRLFLSLVICPYLALQR